MAFAATDADGPHLIICAWNLYRLGEKPLSENDRLNKICTAIINHNFDIVAVQELCSNTVLNEVRDELRLRDTNGIWEQESQKVSHLGRHEYAGFLYKSSRVEIIKSGVARDDGLTRDIFWIRIQAKEVETFASFLCNVHLKANDNERTRDRTREEVRKLADLPLPGIGSWNARRVYLGDFNLPPSDEAFRALKAKEYINLIAPGTPTMTQSEREYDNLWVDPWVSHYHPVGFVGNACESGCTSDHHPVYARFPTKLKEELKKE